jgi:hypothetical protein
LALRSNEISTKKERKDSVLGMKNYTQKYIDGCRSRVDSDLTAYRNLVAAARNPDSANKTSPNSAVDALEGTFFNNMILLLDYFFVHRLRATEGKDGNPLNEVRVLCDSMLHNKNIMSANNTIKLSTAKSVLKEV